MACAAKVIRGNETFCEPNVKQFGLNLPPLYCAFFNFQAPCSRDGGLPRAAALFRFVLFVAAALVARRVLHNASAAFAVELRAGRQRLRSAAQRNLRVL